MIARCRKPGLVLIGVLAAGLAGCGDDGGTDLAPPPVSDPAGEPAPKLVVLIIVDQLPSWSFSRDAEHMRGGIARLLERGTYHPWARFPFAVTYTGPGHATIATGAPPSITGIPDNSWWDRERDREVSAVEDDDAPVFVATDGDGKARLASHGISATRLRVEGLAEALRRATDGTGRSVSVGLKSRGAVLAIGKRPDLAIWYDPDQAAMTTGLAYADALPRWLADHARENPISEHFDHVWRPVSTDRLRSITGIPDDADGEGAEHGLGTTFPHDLSRTTDPARALRATPLAPRMVLDTALLAIEHRELGADDVPDLLAVSLSSHDYAGHYWGQESWERLELLFAIDAALGEFFDELDHRVGAERYAVVLTSDHGVTRLVEHSTAAGHDARRIPTSSIVKAANLAAESILGKGEWIHTVSASTLYSSDRFRAQPAGRRERATDAVLDAVTEIAGIAYAERTEALAGDCDRRSDIEALACRSIVPGRSGDIYLAPEPHCCLSGSYRTGTGHGSPNPDDRTVPILIHGPRIGPRFVTGPVSMLRLAPTVADLLGIPAPEAATAPAL